jgi:O-antigen/teichoic acid export membrane protein
MRTRKLVRDWLGVALSQYLARAMLLVRGLVSASALGPAGYGGWNALNLILDYGTYASLGALQGLDLRLPAASLEADPSRAQRLVRGTWSVMWIGWLAFAVILGASLVFSPHAFAGDLGPWAPMSMLLLALLQLAIQLYVSVLKARGRFGPASAAQAAQFVVGAGIGVLLVGRFGVYGLIGGWFVGTLVALVWLKLAARGVPVVPGRMPDGLALARAGLPVFGFFTASLVLRSVDRLALIRFGDRAELGFYSLGLLAVGLVLYLPEAAATVLFPRIAAAADGALDLGRARMELARGHRALAVTLPLVVGVAMLWAEPVTAWLLPAFGPGVPALRMLALGAMLFAAGTLPGYFLLGTGHAPRLIVAGAFAAAVTAALVFGTAARAPHAAAVAAAAAIGYGLFASLMVALAARELFATLAERWWFAAASFAPALWAGGLALALGALGPPLSLAATLARTLGLALAYLPVLWAFGRGVGLVRFAREWLAPRPSPA